MKKFYIVETSTDYDGVLEYNKFETEEKAIQYIKDNFLNHITSKKRLNEMVRGFRRPYDKDFTLKEIYFDHELFTIDNVSIDDYGEFDYLTLYTNEYNKKQNGLPRFITEALTNKGKRYNEVFYTITKEGNYYDGHQYFKTLKDLANNAYENQSLKYSEQYYNS